jgi:hypothetical protein
MPIWAQVVAALFGASSTAGLIIQAVVKGREERAARIHGDERADRSDVVLLLTNELAFARTEIARERDAKEQALAKAAALQNELYRLRLDADHAADVAQAAMLAFRQGQARVPDDTA